MSPRAPAALLWGRAGTRYVAAGYGRPAHESPARAARSGVAALQGGWGAAGGEGPQAGPVPGCVVPVPRRGARARVVADVDLDWLSGRACDKTEGENSTRTKFRSTEEATLTRIKISRSRQLYSQQLYSQQLYSQKLYSQQLYSHQLRPRGLPYREPAALRGCSRGLPDDTGLAFHLVSRRIFTSFLLAFHLASPIAIAATTTERRPTTRRLACADAAAAHLPPSPRPWRTYSWISSTPWATASTASPARPPSRSTPAASRSCGCSARCAAARPRRAPVRRSVPLMPRR